MTTEISMPTKRVNEAKSGAAVRSSAGFCRMVARWKDKLKAKLRDWCFADYKWITRAQVQGILCCKMWEYRDDSIVSQRVRKALMEVREDIDPQMRTNEKLSHAAESERGTGNKTL